MKKDLHPTWYSEAVVTCACGNTWVTGATVPSIRTDICSNCHPFYTGEQRIVDTEGQVDRFIKRLQIRDQKRQEAEDRVAARTPANLPLAELDLSKRHIALLADEAINTVGEFIKRLEEGGDDAILSIAGVGQKVLADIKRALHSRGFELPESQETVE
ncbi:MAG: 50S ribosomal protein L31 [Chloroflexi bacterium OLB15]|nr:MAG: 50S ribosomal protein L31 [Chloroflexi bacterium OLB15]